MTLQKIGYDPIISSIRIPIIVGFPIRNLIYFEIMHIFVGIEKGFFKCKSKKYIKQLLLSAFLPS